MSRKFYSKKSDVMWIRKYGLAKFAAILKLVLFLPNIYLLALKLLAKLLMFTFENSESPTSNSQVLEYHAFFSFK